MQRAGVIPLFASLKSFTSYFYAGILLCETTYNPTKEINALTIISVAPKEKPPSKSLA